MSAKGFLKYVTKKVIASFLIVVIATYLTVIIANMGGHVDEIVRGELEIAVSQQFRQDPRYDGFSTSELQPLINAEFERLIEQRGLNKPFWERSIILLQDAITLDLGRSNMLSSDSGSRSVKNIILERLPQTIILFTTATMINFGLNLFIGLYLSRNYGSWLDKFFISMSPTSAIPGWFYGIFLILIFASNLHWFPYGGILSVPAPKEFVPRMLDMLWHMVLPLSSWVISAFFLGVYANRTFFLIFSTEDYVEAARAKGVPPRQIERNYILRPALPPIVTNLALTLITSWSGAIITESVFQWRGIGMLTRQAIALFDSPILIGTTIIYAYLLAFTVLVLDILYGIIDPRIRAGFSE